MYMNYIYLEMYRLIPSSDPRTGHTLREPSAAGFWERRLSLYKILFHFKASVWESIILVLPPRHLQSLPYCSFSVGVYHPCIAPPPPAKPTLLQYYCTLITQYTPPTDPPFLCDTPYNIGDGNIV